MTLWEDDNEDRRPRNEASDFFDELKDKRTQPKTKANYKNMFKHFVAFCKQWYPHLLDDEGDVKLDRLCMVVYKAFFDHVSKKRVKGPFSALKEPAQLNTPGYMVSYKSALLWGFKKVGGAMSSEHKDEIDVFIVGYENHYNEAKQRGEVPMKEGKSPMSLTGYDTMHMCCVQTNCRVRASHIEMISSLEALDTRGIALKHCERMQNHVG